MCRHTHFFSGCLGIIDIKTYNFILFVPKPHWSKLVVDADDPQEGEHILQGILPGKYIAYGGLALGDIIIIEPEEDHHLTSSVEDPIVVLWCHAGQNRNEIQRI
ncbi:hypothetical protein O9H85_23925 [Paenibacillus filicis]|uniref:Uncharacterized protein n=1 Tax=Paenibacillus gyeongsangnamensis TaxID=3388067 RepID=A0ABT4QEV1_9BACL|nr:hypothetical protein [Paenibacillus filicis]MCZ8515404.1 hypothetical protein [Paenibacillus filicis]